MNSSNVLKLSISNNLGTKTSGFGAFVISRSIALHFSGKWDFSRGLMEKQKQSTFVNSRQRVIYERLAKSLTVDEIILGNLQMNISQVFDGLSAADIRDASMILRKSLSSNETLANDLINMMRYATMRDIRFTSLFTLPDPMAVRMFSKAYVGFESLIVMDCMANFLTPYRSSDILLEESAKHLLNIKKLFSVNTDALKLLLLECKNNV